MARKKQEIQLQAEIETQEDFDAFLQKPGLVVVDVYQEWCGPCKPIQGQFRKLKFESPDADFLQLAVAKADTIDSLQAYRGKCEPCFLLYAGATLVGALRGVNPAHLNKAVETQIAKEKKVQAGECEREEFFDAVAAPRTGRKGGKAGEEEEMVQKEVTLVILKPDLVAAGRAEELIEKLKHMGLEVLEKEERTLAEDEIAVLYQDHAEKEYFAELKEYMMSGPCMILAVSRTIGTGDGVARELHDLMLGPPNVDEAREQNPHSLRAVFGSEAHKNGLHAASSREMAARELAFFFPGFSSPEVEKAKVQRTVAIIRPEAYAKHAEMILKKIHEAGFQIAIQKEMHMTQEQAEEYYAAHKDEPYFEHLITSMTSGPLLALALVKEDAIVEWRRHLGPGKTAEEAREKNPFSLRATFEVEEAANCAHGASNEEEAKRDINFFFPPQETLVAIKPDAQEKKDDIMKVITDAGFTVKSTKEMQLSEAMAQEFYRDHQDKEYYQDLVGFMANGQTTFLVIERDDAIMRFRELMGPKDPSEAPENTLRKLFGSDVLRNGVHGSSSHEHAKRCVDLIFGSDLGAAAEQQETTEDKSGEHEKQQEEGEKPEGGADGEKHEGEAEGEKPSDEKPAAGTNLQAADAEKPDRMAGYSENAANTEPDQPQPQPQRSRAQTPRPVSSAESENNSDCGWFQDVVRSVAGRAIASAVRSLSHLQLESDGRVTPGSQCESDLENGTAELELDLDYDSLAQTIAEHAVYSAMQSITNMCGDSAPSRASAADDAELLRNAHQVAQAAIRSALASLVFPSAASVPLVSCAKSSSNFGPSPAVAPPTLLRARSQNFDASLPPLGRSPDALFGAVSAKPDLRPRRAATATATAIAAVRDPTRSAPASIASSFVLCDAAAARALVELAVNNALDQFHLLLADGTETETEIENGTETGPGIGIGSETQPAACGSTTSIASAASQAHSVRNSQRNSACSTLTDLMTRAARKLDAETELELNELSLPVQAGSARETETEEEQLLHFSSLSRRSSYETVSVHDVGTVIPSRVQSAVTRRSSYETVSVDHFGAVFPSRAQSAKTSSSRTSRVSSEFETVSVKSFAAQYSVGSLSTFSSRRSSGRTLIESESQKTESESSYEVSVRSYGAQMPSQSRLGSCKSRPSTAKNLKVRFELSHSETPTSEDSAKRN